MTIDQDKVVQFHYHLYNTDDETLIENSYDSEPLLYLHGHRNLLAGVEQALTGHQTGDEVRVELAPEQAYGLRDESASQRIPIKHLQSVKPVKQWRAGMVAQVKTDQGMQQVVVKKPGRFMVEVDTNHPLAGKALRFEMQVIDVRDATAEEIAHGHAHAGHGCGHG